MYDKHRKFNKLWTFYYEYFLLHTFLCVLLSVTDKQSQLKSTSNSRLPVPSRRD